MSLAEIADDISAECGEEPPDKIAVELTDCKNWSRDKIYREFLKGVFGKRVRLVYKNREVKDVMGRVLCGGFDCEGFSFVEGEYPTGRRQTIPYSDVRCFGIVYS